MNTDIHRLLDEAFRGVAMTPDAQDLKEEVRANLVARVDELEAAGVAPADAAQRAIAELGDVRELLGQASAPSAAEAQRKTPWASAEAMGRHRVRPQPGFVVRTVILSLVAAVALILFVLGAFAVVPVGFAGLIGLGLAVSVPLGFVTGDSLQQETTTNHPIPPRRAIGFGLATFGVLEALALGAAFATDLESVWLVIVAVLLLAASIALFSWLGATQTNRHKAWTRQAAADFPPNRFEEEPETAARFGIYTAVIWIVTFAVMAVLFFVAGWLWSLLALVAGFATMMLVLARMMYPPRRR